MVNQETTIKFSQIIYNVREFDQNYAIKIDFNLNFAVEREKYL